MTNDDMKLNRFKRWADARKLVRDIQRTLEANGVVMIGTALRTWQCDKRHAAMFKATKSGAYMQNGKKWVCIDGCRVEFYSRKKAA